MPVEELAEAAQVHRNSLRVHPEGPRIQNYLRQVVRVLVTAEAIFGSRDTAVLWMRNEPLAPFQYRTAHALINRDRTDDVIEYLTSIALGFVG
jgi:uncharacterized protein (DUF2384 family)